MADITLSGVYFLARPEHKQMSSPFTRAHYIDETLQQSNIGSRRKVANSVIGRSYSMPID